MWDFIVNHLPNYVCIELVKTHVPMFNHVLTVQCSPIFTHNNHGDHQFI